MGRLALPVGHPKSNPKEVHELYLEKISRFFRVSPTLFGFIVFGVWQVGSLIAKYTIELSISLVDSINALTWWTAYSVLVVFLLRLKAKYVDTTRSVNLVEEEKSRLLKTFPHKTLRILFILISMAYFMVIQIVFYVYVLGQPFNISSPFEFLYWEAFLPFCGIATGEFFAELFEIALLPFRVRKKVIVDALHYDTYGGLKAVSELFTLSIASLTSIMFLFSLSSVLSEAAGLSKAIGSFWLSSEVVGGSLALVCFFVIPQLFLADRMKEAKHEELNKYYKNMLRAKESKDSSEAVVRLYSFSVYLEVKKMHEYPFSAEQLEKIAVIAFIPVFEKLVVYLLPFL